MIKRENTSLIFYALPPLFFLLGLVAYSNIINTFFISDDFSHLQRILNYRPFELFFRQCSTFYRPLFYLSIFIDYKIWGFVPLGFHITNILIHSLNSFLVFLITRFLFGYKTKYYTYGLAVALISGVLYLFLPSHAEAVTWVSDRADLLAAFFVLVSFLGYYLYTVKNNFKYLFASILFYYLALFSKESVITFPILIISYEFFLNKSQEAKKIKFVKTTLIFMAFTIVFIFYLLARLKAMGVLIGGYGKEVHLNLNYHLLSMNLIAYSARTFFPPSANIKIIFCTLVSIVTLVMIIFKLKRRKFPNILYFILLAYFVSVLPVINLGTNFLKDTQGERFIYLPSVFLVMFLIIFLAHIFMGRKKYFIVVSLIMIILSGIQLFKVNKNWIAAGRISKNIIDSLSQTEKADKLIIVTLPDNINGAYVFRNGLWQAIELFVSPRKFKFIDVVSFCNIFNKEDAMKITKKGNIWLIRALNPNTYFSRIDRRYVFIDNGNSFEFDLSRLDSSRFLYYSSGVMKEIRF